MRQRLLSLGLCVTMMFTQAAYVHAEEFPNVEAAVAMDEPVWETVEAEEPDIEEPDIEEPDIEEETVEDGQVDEEIEFIIEEAAEAVEPAVTEEIVEDKESDIEDSADEVSDLMFEDSDVFLEEADDYSEEQEPKAASVIINSGVTGELKWALDSSGTLTISGNGRMPTYEYDYKSKTSNAPWYAVKDNITRVTLQEGVTGVGNHAFYNCSKLTSVILPEGVTRVGDYAFYNCSKLTSVTLPKSVDSLGNDAFASCSGLTSIVIPGDITWVGSGVFDMCTALKNVTLSGQISEIGYGMFSGCTSLTSLIIPEGVTSIDSCAFADTGLKELNLPRSVTELGGGMSDVEGQSFLYCAKLTAINVDPGNEKYTSENGILYSKDRTQLLFVPGGKNVKTFVIPNSVKVIGGYAFGDCTKLTDVTIPDSVIRIGNFAFDGCASLMSVTVPKSVKNIGQWALGYVPYYGPLGKGSDPVDGFVIAGYSGTAAEAYAKEEGFTFKDLDMINLETAKIKVTLSASGYTYNGKEKKPAVTVKDGSTVLKSGTDYTVSYTNNKSVGVATATVIGQGKYTGTLQKTYTIDPKGTAVSRLSKGSKKFTVKWKKQSTQTTGYQIQYSTNKNFQSGVKTKTVRGAKKTSVTISKLKAKQTYYVRIRTYKTIGKKKYYSDWSKAKSVKTK